MGETQDRPFQLWFNSSLKVDFQGSRVTSDGGLILVRELDERLGLSELMDRHLSDSRRGKNIQLTLADLLRQSIYSRLAGYEDVNDARCGRWKPPHRFDTQRLRTLARCPRGRSGDGWRVVIGGQGSVSRFLAI